MNYDKKALEQSKVLKGKLKVSSKVKVDSKEALSTAYTPGVAAPCREIHKNKEDVYTYTGKGNNVAIITDGSAVLGLGNIGPEAALPVMEGKAVLFNEFADIDAIPICLDTQDTEEIIKTIKYLAPGLGGINLEDISAPRCFEIETRLREELDIPVFHDDQYGTAIVTSAALLNALKLAKKEPKDIKVVISGAGAAGSAITHMLKEIGVNDIIILNSKGILDKGDINLDKARQILAKETNPRNIQGGLKEAIKDSDVFIGVSAPNILTKEMVETMGENPIIFAMANPNPEIKPDIAKEAGAFIVGTGRSDYPNQINNVLVFPGIFRGALDARANDITDRMKISAAYALANLVSDENLSVTNILPEPFDNRVGPTIAKAVEEAWIEENN